MATLTNVKIRWKPMVQHLLASEFADLEQFIRTMDSGLRNEYKSFENFIDKRTEKMNEQEKAEFLDWYADDAFGLLERYPRIQWQSVFISLYAFFEDEMNGYCRKLRELGIVKTSKKHLKKDKNPLPGQTCLEQFAVRLPKSTSEWRRMQAYKAIRNLIVHERGQVRDGDDLDSKMAKRFISRRRDVAIKRGAIYITSDFCLDVVETLRTILSRIVGNIPQTYFD